MNLFSPESRPRVVGSVATPAGLAALDPATAGSACDLVEIRLDGLRAGGGDTRRAAWAHLGGVPLLFTARRASEGGAGGLDAAARMSLLREALPDAAAIDLEVASIDEMRPLIDELAARKLPWIASFHDFEGPSNPATLARARDQAAAAGAAVFKAALTLHRLPDLLALVDFQRAASPLPLAVMGMGPLAAVSRLLCAQCGSVLQYGYLGDIPTAPGQWSAAMLRSAVREVPALPASF